MSTIEILSKSSRHINDSDFIEELKSLESLSFFSEEALNFCDIFSREIMVFPEVRRFPELVSLAFWLRRGELLKLRDGHLQGVHKPRGLAFHIPPANVDTIFIYSWVLSILCGNCNVIRISQRAGRTTQILLECFQRAVEKGFPGIKRNTIFVKFPHESNFLQIISEKAQVRIVWGGDQTIKNVRKVPVSPRAIDLGFADRFSVAILRSSRVKELSELDLSSLAENFYNDAYLFNQKACSSPRLIFWQGSHKEMLEAQDILLPRIVEVAQKKNFVIDESLAMYKLKAVYRGAILAESEQSFYSGPELVNINLKEIKDLSGVREMEFGGGVFFSGAIAALAGIKEVFGWKDQTISVFGFSSAEVVEFANDLTGVGIDRIVPVGEALKFNPVWDGLDLIETFSRRIYVGVK